jgi:hypothetical protein
VVRRYVPCLSGHLVGAHLRFCRHLSDNLPVRVHLDTNPPLGGSRHGAGPTPRAVDANTAPLAHLPPQRFGDRLAGTTRDGRAESLDANDDLRDGHDPLLPQQAHADPVAKTNTIPKSEDRRHPPTIKVGVTPVVAQIPAAAARASSARSGPRPPTFRVRGIRRERAHGGGPSSAVAVAVDDGIDAHRLSVRLGAATQGLGFLVLAVSAGVGRYHPVSTGSVTNP